MLFFPQNYLSKKYAMHSEEPLIARGVLENLNIEGDSAPKLFPELEILKIGMALAL